MSVRLAVVGATGAVGSLVLKLLAERNFPFSHLKLLASKNSVGKTIHFRGKDYPVELLEPGAFRDVDIAIASTPDEVAAEFVPWAIEQGTVVVDESGYHRMRPDVPLGLCDWIMTLLSRRPEGRPPDAIGALWQLEPLASNFQKTSRVLLPEPAAPAHGSTEQRDRSNPRGPMGCL